MAHTYTFTANTINTNLFFGRTPNGSSDVNSVWAASNLTYDNDPRSADGVARWYIADNVASYVDPNGTRRFWICGVYFGVGNSSESADITHLATLAASSIKKIELSFNVNATSADSYGHRAYFQCDTASNATGTNFGHTHTNPKEFLGQDVNINKRVTLDMTSYGFPSSGGWLIHYAATTDLRIEGAVTLTVVTNESYSLSTSAGTGSTITVNRTLSRRGGATGAISNGTAIFYGDVLKITFSAGSNYSITTHTVNGSTFPSGGSHSVTGNVSVVATATMLKSDIGATDANIGSASTITITRYNNSYTHTVTYSCGSASGTIVTKGTNTSISWTVPTTLYAQIPNAKTATCTLTCTTYSGNTSLGSTSTTITVTAAAANCAPTVTGTVVDTNSATIALTGNSSTLVRYKSNAQCTISATANNSATISSKTINGAAPVSGNVTTYSGVSTGTFIFAATDSRGYSSSATVSKTLIAYVQLTCNPTIYRVTPTGSEVRMDVSGAYYRGSFGLYSNTLTLRVRHKLATSSTWGDWTTITSLTNGTNSYSKTGTVLGTSFDYRYAYDFQVQAYDGANGTVLSNVTKTVELQRGIPIFDWGENDFNFHVPIKLGGTQLTEAQLIQLLALIT